MDFKQLETFVSVVKMSSFSKAAEALYLTQPTVSNHIQQLETELGTLLINRSNNKHITLTEPGEVFFRHALDLVNKKAAAVYSLDEYNNTIEGMLEISSSTIPEQYFLPEVLRAFSRQHPKVRFKLKKYDSQQVLDKLASREIDFGLVGAKKASRNLEYIEVMEDEIILIAVNNERYAGVDILPLEALRSEIFIAREEGSGTRKVVETALARHNIAAKELPILAQIENTETIKQCVKQGMGLTFISAKAVSNDLAAGILKRITVPGLEIRRYFYFVYHRAAALSPLAETFKSFLLAHK